MTVRSHFLWSATVTQHTPFYATVQSFSHNTATPRFYAICRFSATDTLHTFGLLTFAINSLCITHLHQFPRFKCTMQCQMAVQPWTTAESSAVHPQFDAISDGDLPWKVVDFSAAHPLLQCNTNGVQPRKAAEPSAVHQQPNSMQNTGGQPWMTAEPLLCTLQVKWFVRSCTMPMWPSEATPLGSSTSWRLRYAPT